MKTGAHPLRGYLYIGAAALFWGIAATLGRAAFTGRVPGLKLGAIDPLILSQSRTTLSFFVLLPILLLRRGALSLRVPGRDVVQFLLLGVLGVAASNYLYYLAIQRTNVATAIILQYTAPVWVLLYTVLRGGQRPTLRRGAAVALAVAGCALAVGFVGSGGLSLDTVGVIAAIVLGELLRPLQTVGIVVVLIAIVLIQLPERAAADADLIVEPIE